jgi:AcrR family transcriptional regulator
MSMSPRPYHGEQRRAGAERTRARILAATRELLEADGGFAGFSVDAVARRADVARMTVYYQFGSKVGLLEALSDDLARRGGMEHLAEAFHLPDPAAALMTFIAVFGRFWSADRLVTRRLRALAALDGEFAQVINARDERRREGLRVIVRRLRAGREVAAPEAGEEETALVAILHMLTSFESFDTLAGPDRRPDEVIPVIQRLARTALGWEEESNDVAGM